MSELDTWLAGFDRILVTTYRIEGELLGAQITMIGRARLSALILTTRLGHAIDCPIEKVSVPNRILMKSAA
ncbi:hypothetical protein GGD63_007985 [Bradyrhizobium sp. cir1]|uniref:hypothetical protein n=1 Tax=Bradyrhizobium sp. cir1 TaxID=1445730 RepID=UPI001606D538|nr:hypothetical protein [Bradyrhizobium sp. cir1]MBB4375138.1 hypothetical protein [Bradyrhizobium sp. cir1]